MDVMAKKLERYCLDIEFTSLTVYELFMSYTSSKKCMTIYSMENCGRFHGLFIMK